MHRRAKGGQDLRNIIGVCLFALATALFVPIGLAMAGVLSDSVLSRLSNLGQAYGVVSALLSAIALAGVAISIFHQAEQGRIHRIQSWRSMHTEMLKIVIDEPATFWPCITGSGLHKATSDEERRQFVFCTLWLNYARAGFEIGRISEEALRGEILANMFDASPGRRHWETVRTYAHMHPDKRSKFHKIVEEEYQKALDVMPASDSRSPCDNL
jgi:hypothetical protein